MPTNLEPVVVPAGKCDRCPHLEFSGDEYSPYCGIDWNPIVDTSLREKWCPIGTQAAIRWTPEIVEET